MAQLENIEAIENRMWNAADTLRANSNYTSNEYFMPVMESTFLPHARGPTLGDLTKPSRPTQGIITL